LEMNANMRRKQFGEMVQKKIALCEYARMQRLIGNAMGGVARTRTR